MSDLNFSRFGIGLDLPLKIPAAWYSSPINLPSRKIGPVAVTHQTITEKTPIIGMRQAVMRGIRPATALLKVPLIIHELRDKNGIWMTDLPEELFQIEEALAVAKPEGRVLVAGLGLGIIAMRCVELDGVDGVTVVEIDKRVIKLCAKRDLYQVVHADIFTFLNRTVNPFDHYMLDIWRGTSESTWWSEVMPLRRLIRKIHGTKPKIHCWAEDIMQGQVGAKLRSPIRDWHYKEFPPSISRKEVAWFFKNIGLPAWEDRYGKFIRKGD